MYRSLIEGKHRARGYPAGLSACGREVVKRFARFCCSSLSDDSELHYQSKHKEVYMYAAAYEQECFSNMLDYALEKAGVAKNPAFAITEGRDGELCLATVHPCGSIIEELLNAGPSSAGDISAD